MAARQAVLVAQTDLGRLTTGQTTWDQVLLERNASPTQTEPFTRSSRSIVGLGIASQEFINAAFGLKEVGNVGGPVEGDRGAYLLRVSKIEESHLPELAEVEDRVREDFIDFEAGNLAYEDALKLADEAFNTAKPLVECAEKLGRKVLESELFKQAEPIPPIGYRAEVNDRAFKMNKEGTVSDAILIRARREQQTEEATAPIERCYVISLLEIKQSYLPELAEVREEVEKEYKLFLATDLAKRKAEEAVDVLKEKIAAGTPVSATRTLDFERLVPASEEGRPEPIEDQEPLIDAAYIRPTNVTQASFFVPGVGRSIELCKTAFALAPGQISGVIEVRESTTSPQGEPQSGEVSGYYIIQVVGREEAGPLALGPQEEQMENFWEQNAQSMAFDAWIDSVSRSAVIELNPELLWTSDLVEEPTEEESVT